MNEPMTDYQFQTILKMVLELLKNSKDIDDAISKVEHLIESKEK